jgi:hypothetical protein
MDIERTMQQKLQQLLANQAEMKADQAKAIAERKADQGRMEANKEDTLAEISASMKSN